MIANVAFNIKLNFLFLLLVFYFSGCKQENLSHDSKGESTQLNDSFPVSHKRDKTENRGNKLTWKPGNLEPKLVNTIDSRSLVKMDLSTFEEIDKSGVLAVKRLDLLTNWKKYERMTSSSYPGSYWKENLKYEYNKFINAYIKNHTFYWYPLQIGDNTFRTILVKENIDPSEKDNYTAEVNVFYINNLEGDWQPVELISHFEFIEMQEFTKCYFYDNGVINRETWVEATNDVLMPGQFNPSSHVINKTNSTFKFDEEKSMLIPSDTDN